MRRIWCASASLLLLLLLLLLSAGCGSGAAQGTAERGPAEPEPTLVPDFELQDIHGNVVRRADFAGQVMLVDFWATWCAPCREEVPMLQDLHREYADDGLALIAISEPNEGPAIVGPFVAEYGIDYLNLIGEDAVADRFGQLMGLETLPGLPTAFLVDREGRIAETFFGPKPRKKLEPKIRELLGLAAEPQA